MRCIAVRHVPFEDLGTFEYGLKAARWDIEYVEAGIDRIPFADVDNAELMVVLGGPIGVNDRGAC